MVGLDAGVEMAHANALAREPEHAPHDGDAQGIEPPGELAAIGGGAP
jgi:hypothetical protein